MEEAQMIHSRIKTALGYEEDLLDVEFLADWKERSTQVCKPCWELKYCPYGPFAEQSPLMPPTRSKAIAHNEYLRECLATGQIGTSRPLSDGTRECYAALIEAARADPDVLTQRAVRILWQRQLFAQAAEEDEDRLDVVLEVLAPPLADFGNYEVPFPLGQDEDEERVIEMTPEMQSIIHEEIGGMQKALASGKDNNRKPLDESRRKIFEASVDAFDPKEYPESIPEEVSRMQCNIFDHICLVVFVGESITETTERFVSCQMV